MGDEGEGMVEHLTKKYGPAAAAGVNNPNSRLSVMGREAGIEFNPSRRMVATQRAHALVEHLKATKGNEAANQLMEDLYKTYFEEGQDISQVALLSEKVEQFGLDAEEAARVMLDAKRLNEIMVQDRQIKKRYGVSGVPFFMIHPNNGGGPPVAFSGAYPVEFIAKQLQKAAD